MAAAFDPDRLPAALRPLVERALRDVDGCEAAIEALERHLSEAAAGPDAFVALALVTYHEAATLLLSRLADASQRALALLDEAERRGGHDTSRLRSLVRASLERERRRERRMLARLGRPGGARPSDVVELAHRLRMRGDHDLAAELLRCADEAEPEPVTLERAAS